MFRKMLRSKVAGLLFALVIVSMAVWGVEDIFSGRGGNLIKAGDRSISIQDFDQEVQDRLRDLSRQQGRAVTKAEAVENGLVDQLYQQQASRLITLGYGEGIGARASTNAVTVEVLKEEAFNNALTGKFDAEVYESALRRINMTPREFEQDIRDSLTQNYIIGAAGTAIEPPSSFVDLISKFEGENRTVSVLTVTTEDVSELPEPSEEELRAYFEENKSAFGEPERRGITVLHFSPEDFRQSVDVSEEMLANAYEAGKLQRYSTPQTRTYVQANFATEAAALQALGILAAGGEPDTLENVISIEEKTSLKSEIVDTEFANDLFAIAPGAVTEPFDLSGQWVIARVEEVIPGDPYPFEDVREQIRSTLTTERAQGAFEEAARNLENLKGEGLNLQEIGQRIGAPAISYVPVDRRGGTASRARILSLLAEYPQAIEETFKSFEGRISDRFDLDDGGIYLAQLDVITPPSLPEFEDVRERVLTAWRVTNSNEAVALFSEDLVQKINRGETTIEDAAVDLNKDLERVIQPLRRSSNSNELPASAVAAVFTAKEIGQAIATPSPQRGEYLIVSVVSILPPSDDTVSGMRTSIRDLLSQQIDADLVGALGYEISGAVDVSTDDAAFGSYKSRNSTQ